MARFDLSDAEWRIIRPLLPNKPRGVARVDDRRVLNGIFFILRTGSPWRDLPERYGPIPPSTTVSTAGPRRAFGSISSMPWRHNRRNPWPSSTVPSSAPINMQRAVKRGADHAIGRSRGGLSTKINAVVDAAGLPIRLSISPGQASDKAAAPALIDSLNRTSHVVADRGYDAMALVERIEARGARAHIPTQRDRKVQRSVDRAIYRQRNLVERYFNKLKHFRRIATRFEKLAVTYLSAVAIASARLWTRAYESTA